MDRHGMVGQRIASELFGVTSLSTMASGGVQVLHWAMGRYYRQATSPAILEIP